MKRIYLTLLVAMTASPLVLADSMPYGIAGTFAFIMLDADGAPLEGEVDAGTEVSLNCDDAGAGTATNDFTESSDGGYELVVTAAEVQCANLIVDVAASVKNVYKVETYGHPDSQHPAIGAGVTAFGTAQANASTTTLILAAATAFGDDEIIGQLACVYEGAGAEECETICDFVASTDTITSCAAFETAPTTTSKYSILKDNLGFLETDLNGYASANVVESEGGDPSDAYGDAVWDEAKAGHVTTTTFGDLATDVDTTNEALIILGGEQTADAGGSTTSLVDAALTQASNDWFIDVAIIFTAGQATIAGTTSCIDGFVSASDTLVFSPAVPAAVGAGATYYLVTDKGCARFR